jgi:hypothetical protein
VLLLLLLLLLQGTTVKRFEATEKRLLASLFPA